MFILKTLKNAPTCFVLIQVIFMELVCSLLKTLILKFVKNVKSQLGLPIRPRNSTVLNRPWTSIQDILHPNS